jgi:hypothetical protein
VANLLTPMAPNQNMTAPFFNDSIDNARTIKYQAADSIRNNTILFLDSTDLTAPMVALASYIFEGYFFYDTSATTDIIIRLRAPIASALLISQWGSGTGITTATNSINMGAVSGITTVDLVYGGVSSGTIMSVNPRGWISTLGDTTGGFVVAHSQNVAAAGNTLLKQGSYFTLARVA